MFSGRSNERTIWGRIGWWLAEIVVVFIGVYLAFLLEGYRTDKQNERKKQQVYTALHSFFSTISPNLEESAQYSDSVYVKPFLEPYQNDEMPRLKPLPFLTLTSNEGTWRAMLQSGAIDLLDTSFILQVDYFFFTNEILRQESTHFNRMQDQYLLPNTNADISTFYNTDTKRLKPLYRWYVEFLKKFPDLIETQNSQISKIIAELEQKMSDVQLEKIKADSLEETKRDSIEQVRSDSLENASSPDSPRADSTQ